MNSFESRLVAVNGNKAVAIVNLFHNGLKPTNDPVLDGRLESVTRHLVRQGLRWMGNNPNPAAKPANMKAEQRLSDLENSLTSDKLALEKLEANKKADPEAVADLKNRIRNRAEDVKMAKKYLADVREKLPLQVEFFSR